MIRKTKNQDTLADKIADILYTAPETYDPEDDIHDETRAKVADFQEDNDNLEELTSNFRKQNIEYLEDVDKRYVGKKGSRKSLQDSHQWETDESLSTDEGEALDGIPGTRDISSSKDEESIENESVDGDDSEYESTEEDGINKAHEENEGRTFKHMSDTNISSQARKGNCVRNQLNLWENLLEIRIQLQKCLVAANKMPQYGNYNTFKTDENFKTSVSERKRNISTILEKLLSLQLLLFKQYSETKTLMKEKKVESDEEILSDTNDEMKSENEESDNEQAPLKRRKLADYEQEIKTRHEKYKHYRNSVIQKWNEKTRLTVGKASTPSNSVLQQINFLLQDKQKLVRRTQLKRSQYEIIGKEQQSQNEAVQENRATNEYDTEIFDDDDFYHQLLRELIEFKSAGVTDPIQMSRQWIMLQNFRSKMKKKVDTKASKGRKIRYALHSKLVNFMAPIDQNLWTEESKNELYSSLFGTTNNVYKKSKG